MLMMIISFEHLREHMTALKRLKQSFTMILSTKKKLELAFKKVKEPFETSFGCLLLVWFYRRARISEMSIEKLRNQDGNASQNVVWYSVKEVSLPYDTFNITSKRPKWGIL